MATWPSVIPFTTLPSEGFRPKNTLPDGNRRIDTAFTLPRDDEMDSWP